VYSSSHVEPNEVARIKEFLRKVLNETMGDPNTVAVATALEALATEVRQLAAEEFEAQASASC
jgi:hypothetical protein